MSYSLEVLSNRAMSSYLVSIGTSLALESLQLGPNSPYDLEREIPQQVQIDDYKYLYINIATLYRNLVGSVSIKDPTVLSPADVLHVLDEEIRVIKSVISDLTHNKVEVVLYHTKFKDMDKRYPYANLRKPTTEKQLAYDHDCKLVLDHYVRDNKDVVLFDRDFKPGHRSRILIMTHYAHDLLNYKEFDKFDLLESHTGILKTPSMFYTKLLNGKDLNRIQFNRLSIQVFGDRETFSPMGMNVKKTVLELAERYNWTQATTQDRLYYCLNTITDTELRDTLKSLIV